MRYVRLHYRNAARVLDIFFWPAMELMVWGFFTLYLGRQLQGPVGRLLSALLTGVIFWDVLFRSQQAVSLSLMEEMWTRNVLNILLSPLRTWEWVAAVYLYGFMKTAVTVSFMTLLAWGLYAYDANLLGVTLVPFFANLLLMGWGLGLVTSGLLLRWGHSAEAIIWGVPFLIQPFSAFFYPLSVYPSWLRPLCELLPSTHVMEGMREVALHGSFSWARFGLAAGMNVVLLALGGWFYLRMLERCRRTGQLVRLAQ